MTLVEFAEDIIGLKLWESQKRFLEELEKFPRAVRLIGTRDGRIFTLKGGADKE